MRRLERYLKDGWILPGRAEAIIVDLVRIEDDGACDCCDFVGRVLVASVLKDGCFEFRLCAKDLNNHNF